MANGDIHQLRVCFYDGDQLGENVLHAEEQSNTGGGANEQQIATAWETAVVAAALPLCDASITFIGVTAKKIWPTQSVEAISNASAGPCSNVSGNLPKQSAALITLRTATAGRRGLGRVYTPFPPIDSSSVTGKVTVGYIAKVTTYAAALTNAFTAGGGGNTTTLKAGVYSRDTHTLHPLTFVNVAGVFATQRKRGDYGRKNPRPF